MIKCFQTRNTCWESCPGVKMGVGPSLAVGCVLCLTSLELLPTAVDFLPQTGPFPFLGI